MVTSKRLQIGAVFLILALVGTGVVVATQLNDHPGTTTPALQVDKVDDDSKTNGQVVAFENLTADQQQIFTQALNDKDGIAELPEDKSRNWDEIAAVQYQNQTYRTDVMIS